MSPRILTSSDQLDASLFAPKNAEIGMDPQGGADRPPQNRTAVPLIEANLPEGSHAGLRNLCASLEKFCSLVGGEKQKLHSLLRDCVNDIPDQRLKELSTNQQQLIRKLSCAITAEAIAELAPHLKEILAILRLCLPKARKVTLAVQLDEQQHLLEESIETLVNDMGRAKASLTRIENTFEDTAPSPVLELRRILNALSVDRYKAEGGLALARLEDLSESIKQHLDDGKLQAIVAAVIEINDAPDPSKPAAEHATTIPPLAIATIPPASATESVVSEATLEKKRAWLAWHENGSHLLPFKALTKTLIEDSLPKAELEAELAKHNYAKRAITALIKQGFIRCDASDICHLTDVGRVIGEEILEPFDWVDHFQKSGRQWSDKWDKIPDENAKKLFLTIAEHSFQKEGEPCLVSLSEILSELQKTWAITVSFKQAVALIQKHLLDKEYDASNLVELISPDNQKDCIASLTSHGATVFIVGIPLRDNSKENSAQNRAA